MKHVYSIGIVLLMMSLVACDSNKQETASVTPPIEKTIILSEAGVGPLNATTPFNIHQITLAFDDYSVTEYTKFREGESSPVIRVSEGGTPLIIINPDTKGDNIFSIVINSNKIGTTLGHQIGSRYQDIYNYENKEPCIPGVEELSGKVLCIAPKTPNIIYQFHGQWDGPDGEKPPTDILSTWVLQSIIWKPEG
jgi:hypothetical protein